MAGRGTIMATPLGVLALAYVVMTTIYATDAAIIYDSGCPPKKAYTAFSDVSFPPVEGIAGVVSGSLPSGDAAAEFCRYEPRCTYFNSRGDYVLGGLGGQVDTYGVCSYVKDACPPLDGFVAHADLNVKTTIPPSGQVSAKCFNDVWKACAKDPNCIAFNKERHTWSGNTAASATNLADNLDTMPGECVYIRNLTVTAAGCSDGDAALALNNALRFHHNAPALSWNHGLAVSSQNWAQHLASGGCSLSHETTGENLYGSWSSAVFTSLNCSAAVASWYSEIKDYLFTSTPWTDNQAHFGSIGHFTQVVWAKSKHFGCGAAAGPDGKCYVVTCRYTPPGNIATNKDFYDNVKPLVSTSGR